MLAILLALWLLRSAGRRVASLWLLAFLACAGGIAMLKVYFLACPLPHGWLRSPSGHAGLSLFIYGGIALCGSRDPEPRRGLILVVGGCTWVGAIAWSRYALHAHTGSEIALGLAVGAAALAGFALKSGPLPRARFPLVPTILAAAFLSLGFSVAPHQVQFESLLGHIGGLLPWLPLCGRAAFAAIP